MLEECYISSYSQHLPRLQLAAVPYCIRFLSIQHYRSTFCINGSRYYVFFFFQAEDGIRDYKVTGVQTCALPIFRQFGSGQSDDERVQTRLRNQEEKKPTDCLDQARDPFAPNAEQEERVLDLALDRKSVV